MDHLTTYLLAEELTSLSSNDFHSVADIVGWDDKYLSWNEQQKDQKDSGRPCSNKVLATNISRFAGNQIVNEVRPKGDPVGYLELLIDVLEAVNKGTLQKPHFLKTWPNRAKSLIDIDEYPHEAVKHCFQAIYEEVIYAEEAVLGCVASSLYESLTPEQKLEFDRKVKEIASTSQDLPIGGVATAGGLMLLGNLGGFGTYMVMSSLLSTISLGTLGFGAYTAASSLLSFLLGPVGWAALGAVAVHTLGKPDLNKLAGVVITVAMARRQHPLLVNNFGDLAKSTLAKLEPDYPPQKIGIGFIDGFISGYSGANRKRAIERAISAAKGVC